MASPSKHSVVPGEPRPVRRALLEEGVPAFDRLVRAVSETGGFTGKKLRLFHIFALINAAITLEGRASA